MFSTVEDNEIRGSRDAGVMTYGKSNRLITNLITDNLGSGAKLGGLHHYIAHNTCQSNAIGAVGEAADNAIARDELANIFLLDSGEVDAGGATHGRTRHAEA